MSVVRQLKVLCKLLVYVQSVITSARRNCDTACLLVGWFVRSLKSDHCPEVGQGMDTDGTRGRVSVVTGGLTEVAVDQQFFYVVTVFLCSNGLI